MVVRTLPDLPFFEDLFETHFADIRIILGDLPGQYHAGACAFGNDIFVQTEHWNPASRDTIGLLAHELAHVAQFRQGRVDGNSRVLLNRDLEREATLASAAALGHISRREIACLAGSRPRCASQAKHILCQSDWVGDDWWGGKKRPAWAGNVRIRFEEITHPRRTIIRPIQVTGLIAPGSTSGRPSAPEPICGWRVGMEAKVPKRFQYDSSSGLNAMNTGIVDAEKGHIMALELGGPDIPENIVPQWAKWQGSGEWRRLEVELMKDAQKTMKTAGQFLLFDCLVLYFSEYQDIRYISERKVCVPRGFKVQTTVVNGSGQPLQPPVLRFDKEQMRNETDDMLALRAMEMVEQQADPSFRMADAYDDVSEKKKKGKTSLSFGKSGQSSIYAPPPVTYPPKTSPTPGSNLFSLNTQMATQSKGLDLRRRFLAGEFNLPPRDSSDDMDTT